MYRQSVRTGKANCFDNEDVQEKAKAAIKWCECASQVDADGKTWEYRLVPGDKIIVGNTFKYVIGMAIPVVLDILPMHYIGSRI